MSSRRVFLKLLAATSVVPACTSENGDSSGELCASNSAVASATAAASASASAKPAAMGIDTTKEQLVFLGTQGGPQYTLTRGESASALIIGGQIYLVDCGYGTMRALIMAGLNYMQIGQVFLTHLHDDHSADLAALLGHQWTRSRPKPTVVYGPTGTDELVAGVVAFNTPNARIRAADEGRTMLPKDMFSAVMGQPMDTPFEIYKDANVTVTCVENTHFPDESKAKIPDRSFAYRFQSAARSIVFTGDTKYSENVVALAKDADILVCEAMDTVATRVAFDAMVAGGAYGDNPEGVWNHIVGTHVPCPEAGKMAAAANVKTLIINHLVPGALNPAQTDQMYIDQIRPNFSGNIMVSADGMIVPVG